MFTVSCAFVCAKRLCRPVLRVIKFYTQDPQCKTKQSMQSGNELEINQLLRSDYEP